MEHEVRFRRSRGRPALACRVARGTPLLDAVRAAGLPLGRGCGGAGLCARCGVRVLRAAEGALAAEDEGEARAKARNRVPAELRLACRAAVRGDLEVSAAPW